MRTKLLTSLSTFTDRRGRETDGVDVEWRYDAFSKYIPDINPVSNI